MMLMMKIVAVIHYIVEILTIVLWISIEFRKQRSIVFELEEYSEIDDYFNYDNDF